MAEQPFGPLRYRRSADIIGIPVKLDCCDVARLVSSHSENIRRLRTGAFLLMGCDRCIVMGTIRFCPWCATEIKV